MHLSNTHNQLVDRLFKHSQGNEIGDEGAGKIAEALAVNHTLTTLDLGVRFALSNTHNQLVDRNSNIHSAMKLYIK